MEQAEQQRLDAFTAKKALEKSKRDLKRRSHQQIVSRTLAKKFLRELKVQSFVDLRDVGYFGNKFKQEVLETNVMPWLYKETQNCIGALASQTSYPTTLINNYLETKAQRHTDKVKEYREMIKARRAAEKQAEEDKIRAKQERKAKRFADAKAA